MPSTLFPCPGPTTPEPNKSLQLYPQCQYAALLDGVEHTR